MIPDQPPLQRELPLSFPERSGDTPLLPARMINEYQYCPRLAYLEWVQGEWLQLSVFQCRLSRKQYAEMLSSLYELIHHGEDHVLIIHLGPADSIKPSIVSLGKSYETIERQAIIV